MVLAVDPLPGAERNQRKERREVPDEAVKSLRPEERLVPALVKEREPLEQGERQQDLPEAPERDAAPRGEKDGQPGQSRRNPDGEEADCVPWPQMSELGSHRSPARAACLPVRCRHRPPHRSPAGR